MNIDKGLLNYILQIRWKLMVQDWCRQFVGELHLRDMKQLEFAPCVYSICVVDKHVGIVEYNMMTLRFDYDLFACKMFSEKCLCLLKDRSYWRQHMVNEIVKYKSTSDNHFDQYQYLCFYYNDNSSLIINKSRENLFEDFRPELFCTAPPPYIFEEDEYQ